MVDVLIGKPRAAELRQDGWPLGSGAWRVDDSRRSEVMKKDP
jgi:hypothetical protein